jgi:hypothetical protein
MTGFQFRPAVRENVPIRLGIAGPSRSGKTWSALRIARGIVGGDMNKVFVIDTEPSGASMYADQFPGFMRAKFEAPFAPRRYLEALRAAHMAGAGVTIVDSGSHLHEGEGGILAMHDAELQRMAGDNYAKREQMKFSAWIAPKAQYREFLLGFLAMEMHTIWCFRAKEKLKMIKNATGKMEPTSIGYQPIITDGFEYELLSLIMLGEGSKGVPDLKAQATAFRDPIDKMIVEGVQLDEEVGRKLAAWAKGGGTAQSKRPADMPRAETPAVQPSDRPAERDWAKFGAEAVNRIMDTQSLERLDHFVSVNEKHLVGYKAWNAEKHQQLLELINERRKELEAAA